jgi:hypothetical protein
MIALLALPGRWVYYLRRTAPAVFYIADAEAGGILVNTPRYAPQLAARLAALAPLRYAFFPSRLGARDVEAWRAAGVRTIAWGRELAGHGATDVVLDRSWRFSRTMDFLPMSGRTAFTCALRSRTKPAIVFFGPALSCGPDGWPRLVPHPDDHSYENRLIGALALRHSRFDYAFTDDFDPLRSRYGPGAGRAIAAALDEALAA